MYSQEQWKRLFDGCIEECRRLARVKSGEYSGDDDRLRNFRRAGEDQGLPAEVVWRVYAGKHWDAIGQHIKDIREGRERVKGEPIEGRAHDLIVYLMLFLAMCEERKETAEMLKKQPGDTFHNPQSTDRACIEVGQEHLDLSHGETGKVSDLTRKQVRRYLDSQGPTGE